MDFVSSPFPLDGCHMNLYWPVQRIRGEFLMCYNTKLSSSVFTLESTETPEGNVSDELSVLSATEFLLKDTIPALADSLVLAPSYSFAEFASRFHKRGVNLRYLGTVYLYIKSNASSYETPDLEFVLNSLLCEMFSRAFKSVLNSHLRKVLRATMHASSNDKEPLSWDDIEPELIAGITDVLNRALGTALTSAGFYSGTICKRIFKKFNIEIDPSVLFLLPKKQLHASIAYHCKIYFKNRIYDYTSSALLPEDVSIIGSIKPVSSVINSVLSQLSLLYEFDIFY